MRVPELVFGIIRRDLLTESWATATITVAIRLFSDTAGGFDLAPIYGPWLQWFWMPRGRHPVATKWECEKKGARGVRSVRTSRSGMPR